MKAVGILVLTIALTGCWSLRPSEHIEFIEPVAAERSILDDASPLLLEKDDVRLVGAANVGPGQTAFYYVPRAAALDAHLNTADVVEIDIYADGDVRPADSAIEFADARDRFPRVFDYRERKWGYEVPEEDDVPGFVDPAAFTTDRLRWEFTFRVAAYSPDVDDESMLSVHVVAEGTQEDNTQRIRAYFSTEDHENVRVDLPRTTFGIKRGMDAEIQRFMRSIVWNGRDTAIVSDRVVDLDRGNSYRLVDRAPTEYIEQVIAVPGSQVVTFVFGDYRVTKRVVDAPLSRPLL